VHHGIEFTIVVIVAASLVVGAATRVLSQRLNFPYTIALLLLGFLAGMLVEFGGDPHHVSALNHAMQVGAQISPNLIIFVFLPALVFESAFALEFYSFKRDLGAILILAIPALLLSTVLTAFAMQVITAGHWQWTLATGLVFGALISATDPVAVVAILRDLGAPKRLGTLIEGESLMNDGTAIVVFNVLIGLLAGTTAELDVAASGIEFLRVAAGGIVVGLLIGITTTIWLSRTFNDPMVEITLTVVCAYSAMLIAEGGFHVSGVLAIVTAGLWMSSVGRSRISPEVAHFLHEFWEMLAYISNTVIFLLVGLLVGTQMEQATLGHVVTVLVTWVVIMIIRTILTFGFLPLLNKVGERISVGQAAVMTWGGLRGAVSLALALVVFQREDIPLEIRNQILFVTAGVVMLTIVVNGGTIGRVLKMFGFDQPPPGVALASVGAEASVLDSVRGSIDELSKELRTVRWDEVEADLDARRAQVQARMSVLRTQLHDATPAERAAGYWQQALAVERQAYWSLLGQGMVGARALGALNRELDAQIDSVSRGELDAPKTRLAETSGLAKTVSNLYAGAAFERLVLIHDLSRAEAKAADKVLDFVDGLKDADNEVVESLRSTYRHYRREAKERLEDLRTNLPEMTEAIETRLAHRIELNMERDNFHKLVKKGVLDHETATPALSELETRMKRLLHSATRVELPETADLVRRAPLFSALDEEAIGELADLTAERVYSPGEFLFKQGDKGDAVYIIARGAVHILIGGDTDDNVVDVLGGGDILGEMALLSGEPRQASIRAATTLTVGIIQRDAFLKLLSERPSLSQGVWLAYTQRSLGNLLREDPRFEHLDETTRTQWARKLDVHALPQGGKLGCDAAGYAFVVQGDATIDGERCGSPALVSVKSGTQITTATDARVALLPDFLAAGPDAASE